MNIIAKGGYCLVDMAGVKLGTTSTVPGIYDRIVDAYNSAKPIILCGLKDNSIDELQAYYPVSPVFAHIKTGQYDPTQNILEYKVCFGTTELSVLSNHPNTISATDVVATASDILSDQIDSLDERVTALEGAGEGA